MTAAGSTPTRSRRPSPGGASAWRRCGSARSTRAAAWWSSRGRGRARPYGWGCDPMAETPIRVLVVDDHPVVRQGLRTFLDLQPDITVVGEAADGDGCVEVAAELRPDVVLLDLRMPGADGLAA